MRRPHNSGLTLVEMILYTAILSIVVVGLVRFALTLTGDRSRVVAQAEVEGNARALSETLRYYIRYADDVVVPTSGTTTNLILDMPLVIPTTTILRDGLGIVQFGEDGVGTTSITSNDVNVSSLNFVRTSLGGRRSVIRVLYTIQYSATGTAIYERDYVTTVFRRK